MEKTQDSQYTPRINYTEAAGRTAKDYFSNHDDHHIEHFRRHMKQVGFQLSLPELEEFRERFSIIK